MKIKLNDIADVQCFVNSLQYYEGDVTAHQGRYIIDGRSFMGMCSLRLSEPFDVTIATPDKLVEEDFYNMLHKWEV